MWEFDIYNESTGESNIIFGYNLLDAFRRNPSLNPNEWTCTGSEYID